MTEPKPARSRRKAPRASETPGERLKAAILSAYELNPAEAVLLDQAAALADALERLNREIAGQETFITKGSKGQPSVSALLAAQRQHAEVLARVLEGLALPATPEEDEGELSTSKRARKAATVRWAKEAR